MLRYKKTALGLVLIVICTCVVVGVCFLTRQKEEKNLETEQYTEEQGNSGEEGAGEGELQNGDDMEEQQVLIDNPYLEDEKLEEIQNYLLALPNDMKTLSEDSSCMVITYSGAYGRRFLTGFQRNYEKHNPATLTIGTYTDEGDLILHYLSYDGEKITYVIDTRRDYWGNPQIVVTQYNYFFVFEEETKEGEIYETLLLNDTPDATAEKWHEILYSSQFNQQVEGMENYMWICSFITPSVQKIKKEWYHKQDYPIKDWSQLCRFDINEQMDILNPPEELLKGMSTQTLAGLSVSYPMYACLPWYPDEEKATQLDIFAGWSDIFRELINREDMVSCVLQEYQENEPNLEALFQYDYMNDVTANVELFVTDFVLVYGSTFTKEEREWYERIAAEKEEKYYSKLPEHYSDYQVSFNEKGQPIRKERERTGSEEIRLLYNQFMHGEIPLAEDSNGIEWNIPSFIGNYPKYEYYLADLDGIGVEELIVQMSGSPEGYNGVFHLDVQTGKIYCWQSDGQEGNCRDYPLNDGTFVRQYDFGGNTTYTIFRYREKGETEEISHLIERNIKNNPADENIYPYYEVDGKEMTKEGFADWVQIMITDKKLPEILWQRFN